MLRFDNYPVCITCQYFLGADCWETASRSCPFIGRAMPKRPSPSSDLICTLSPTDFGLLDRHLRAVALPIGTQLEVPNTAIENVYFIERDFASVVAK
jgi:hypothetical protein